MQCQHGIKSRQRSNSNVRKCKTKYYLHSTDLCQFRINISLYIETNIWYLRCRKGQRKTMLIYTNIIFQWNPLMYIHTFLYLSKKELKLISECSQIHINNTRTISLINIRNILGIQNQWTRYQIRYLSEINDMLSGLTSNSLSVELLIEALSGRDDTNYLYMTFEPSERLILMTGEKLMYLVD